MHLERLADTAASELGEDFAAHGLLNSNSSNTHDHGGMLDIVVCRSDMPMPHVDVVDVSVSDHRLLSWSVPMVRESPRLHVDGQTVMEEAVYCRLPLGP